ncbi:MAG: MBL fold metallo-hydrolase [Clostridiales Family XIII bacterium]|jgi:beta-lactamase superfamily II metal-dependent hydrolase|nr:MBL fold metallo-hydrolase [Clostridiales Family XIII bacterium]
MKQKTSLMGTKTRFAYIIAMMCALSLTIAGCAPPSEPTPTPAPAGEVAIHVFDVGEGLAVLIDDGDVEVVIDGGYKQYGAPFSDYIKSYVVATHSHADHVGGLSQIYADYQVDHTIYGDTGTSGQYKNFENAAMSEPDSDFKNDETETITLSDGVTLSIVDVIDGDSNTNNNSVISVLDAYGKKTLITGDAEDKAEQPLLGFIGDVDIYVVGHHGSETSSSQAFLDEIRPEYGIISSQGPNKGKYNNPDIEVLRRLSALGTQMYATYRSRTIVATINDGAITLSPPLSEQITPENYKEAA